MMTDGEYVFSERLENIQAYPYILMECYRAPETSIPTKWSSPLDATSHVLC
jgi:hypothetical protein